MTPELGAILFVALAVATVVIGGLVESLGDERHQRRQADQRHCCRRPVGHRPCASCHVVHQVADLWRVAAPGADRADWVCQICASTAAEVTAQ